MKRIILFLTIILLTSACSIMNTPSSVVEDYLNKYINLYDDVLSDVESSVSNENLSLENKQKYKNVLIRLYQNLKYEIKDETIDNDKAEVMTRITIYDLAKAEEESQDYMNNHIDEFKDVNNFFDNDTFDTYRINSMLNENDKVEYDIKFKLTKKDNEWIINPLDRISLEKIHGLYKNN